MIKDTENEKESADTGAEQRLVMPVITQADIGNVIESICSSFSDELFAKKEDELEEYWFFKWDDSVGLEQNIYEFNDMLDLYKSSCSQWEEHHNGSCCVVERVRDKYLMPKIKEFAIRLKA